MATVIEQLREPGRQGSIPRRSSARVSSLTSSYEASKGIGERSRVKTSKMISWQEHSDRVLEKFQPREFRKDDLRPFYHLSLKEAANQLGICATTLKRVCRRLGIRKWPRRALARLSQQQDGAAQPEPPELSPQPQPACSTPPAMSLELQTCGSGASSATNICKGSQSPPEALSQWAQAPGSGTFDLLDVEDIPRPQKPLPHLSQLPAMQQVNDWNDPLPFSLDTWYLDGATRVPPLPRHRGSEGISGTPYSPQQLQQTQLHYPIELDGNSPALSWEEIPQGLLSFPSSPTFPNAGHLQHDVTSGKDILDQSFLSDTRSDLAMLQRALGQPERAPSQGPQQSTQFDANPAGPQLLSANLPYAPALWDMPADNLAPTFAARSTAAVMPSVHMPHDFQGAGFGAECPFSNASSLEPFPECALVTDDWSSGYPHGPGVQPGPILRGRVIAPAEYRAQPSSFHSRL